ncbi:MAG: hypothetical protein QFX37_07725 [Archaeoglobales archaeon]|nr:hypothetical protein [Archaeoglobales archaeon]
MKSYIFLGIILAILLCCCIQQGGLDVKKCLEALGNEIDQDHTFTGIEKHRLGESEVEMCCAKVTGEKGVVKYCFEPVLSELSPIDYRNAIYWSLNESGETKLLEGYEKNGKFFWISYEDGRFSGMVEYYKENERICAKFFDAEKNLVGNSCE